MAALTTLEEMQKLFSAQGVASFSDHNNDGFEDLEVVETCVRYASNFLGGKLAKLYELVALANAPVLREYATVIACRTLCYRRGNPVPESLENRYQEILERGGLLEDIISGNDKLLDEDGNLIPGRRVFGPTMSNLRVDRRYRAEKIRVVQQSSMPVDSKLERDMLPGPEVFNGL